MTCNMRDIMIHPYNEMPSLLGESFPSIYLSKAATERLRIHKIPETITNSHCGFGWCTKDKHAKQNTQNRKNFLLRK